MAESTNKKSKFQIFKNIGEVLKLTNQYEPRTPLFLGLTFFVPFIIGITLAIIIKNFTFGAFGFLIGLLLALFTLTRLADKVGFERIEGQPGAAGAVLNQIKLGGAFFEEQPVAFNQKTMDLVFRGTSRSGIIFVTEGPISRVKPLVNKEIAKVKRAAAEVPIHIINTGNDEGQVQLKKLKRTVLKLKITLRKDELIQLQKRMRAIGGFNMPIPKGIDPTRMKSGTNRRALRGK